MKSLKHIFIPVIALLLLNFSTGAQTKTSAKLSKQQTWQLLDYEQDTVYGTSVNRAYEELLKGKKSHPVIVAVIDGGVDITHEDLQGHIWTNKKEIPGNSIDDDGNGYIDDMHGWNFLGGKDGRNMITGGTDVDREYVRLFPEYSTIKDSSMVANQKEYKYFLFIQNKHVEDSISRISTIQYVENTLQKFETADSLIKKRDSKQVIYLSDATSFTPTDSAEADIKKFALDMFVVMPSGKSLRDYINDGESFLNRFKGMQSLAGNEGKLRKEIIGDDPYNINDRDYGNNIVGDTIIDHGTQCSGIIAAIRNNGVGMDGVADNVQIMSVRAAKKGGDEWDKDIALAIRYAVDNGAKIISMSFGKKPLSPQKKWVDEAIEYAEKNNVLLIHGSGNDHDNIDSVKYYPNDDLLDSLRSVNNFINVGAIKMDDSLTLSTSFSNYGQKNVDVFAPGEDIYSTIAANKYNFDSGTSMATPVVAGVAALILEYYPKLKAEQLKDIIMKSVTSLKGKMVYKPGTEEKVDFSTLCVSGGVVNAYKALQLAAEITSHKKANM